MKAVKKSLALICLMVIMVFGTALTAQAAYKQTALKPTSIQITWDDPNASSTYYTTIAYHVSIGTDYSTIIKTFDFSNAAIGCTITGLKAGQEYYVKVTYDEKTSSKSYYGYSHGSGYCRTSPANVTGYYVDWNSYNGAKVSFEVDWTKQGCSGYEYYLKNNTGGVVEHATKTSAGYNYIYKSGINRNTTYQVMVRAYSTPKDSTTKYYSAWTTYYVIPEANISANKKKTKINNGKLYIKWTKVKGATGYDIYVSTKSNIGYKKLKSVGAKKTKATIDKFKKKSFKNNKTYYVKIVTKKKVGKTVYDSNKMPTYEYAWIRRSVY